MPGILSRESLTELFQELSERLELRRVRAHVYVVGGAAMVLGHSRDRSTEDIDARIESGHTVVVEGVREIARERGLSEHWPNEQVSAYIPRRRDERARTLFGSPSLVVTGAYAEPMLAMKLRAGRETDREDIEILMERLDVETLDEFRAIHDEVFPDSPLSGRKLRIAERALAAGRVPNRTDSSADETQPRDPKP